MIIRNADTSPPARRRAISGARRVACSAATQSFSAPFAIQASQDFCLLKRRAIPRTMMYISHTPHRHVARAIPMPRKAVMPVPNPDHSQLKNDLMIVCFNWLLGRLLWIQRPAGPHTLSAGNTQINGHSRFSSDIPYRWLLQSGPQR